MWNGTTANISNKLFLKCEFHITADMALMIMFSFRLVLLIWTVQKMGIF